MSHLSRLEEINKIMLNTPYEHGEMFREQTIEVLDLLRQVLSYHYTNPTVSHAINELKPSDPIAEGALDICCSINSYLRSEFVEKAKGISLSINIFLQMCEGDNFFCESREEGSSSS